MAGFEINLLCPGGSVTFSWGNKGLGRGKSMILNKITFVLITWMFPRESCQWNFQSGSEHDSRPPGNWSLKEDGAIKFFANIQIFRQVLGSYWLEGLSSIEGNSRSVWLHVIICAWMNSLVALYSLADPKDSRQKCVASQNSIRNMYDLLQT